MSNESENSAPEGAGHSGPIAASSAAGPIQAEPIQAEPIQAGPIEAGPIEAGEPRGRGGNVDAIRDLLRKLEEAAEETAQSAGLIRPGESLPITAVQVAGQTELREILRESGLATLRRTGSSALSATSELAAFRPREIDAVARPLALPLPGPGISNARGRGAAIAIGAASFVLGVGAAAGVIVVLDPFKPLKPVVIAAKAPAGSLKSSPTGTAVVANALGVRGDQPKSETTEARSINVAEASSARGSPAEASRPPASVQPPVEASRSAVAIPVARQVAVPEQIAIAIVAAARIELRAGESRSLALRVEPAPGEADPILIVLRGVPAWLTISKGSTIGDEIWLLPGHQAGDLALVAVEGADGSADIKVQLAHLDGRILAETTTHVRASKLVRPSLLVAAVPEAGEQSLLRLLARGELLLDTGEVEAARLLLRTAAEGGSVAAALKLAQTYDPGEMRRLGMAETSADPAQAVRWYERAQSLGSPTAAARLSELSAR
jgi:hypothetical protein